VRFSFDDPRLLDDCPFMAKIGVNEDQAVPGKYIGFAYGNDVSKMSDWAKRFLFAEIIDRLDDGGVSTDESKKTRINSWKYNWKSLQIVYDALVFFKRK